MEPVAVLVPSTGLTPRCFVERPSVAMQGNSPFGTQSTTLLHARSRPWQDYYAEKPSLCVTRRHPERPQHVREHWDEPVLIHRGTGLQLAI